MVTTHYHVDHVGGMQELAKQIPIKHFVDHGPSVEEREQVAGFQAAYAELRSKAKHTVVKPGDKLAVAGLDWRDGDVGGQGDQDAAARRRQAESLTAPSFKPRENLRDPENAQSLGSVITLRQVPRDRSRRSAVEQRRRSHVPDQSDRDGRRLPRDAPRHRSVRRGGARARAAASRRDHAERHAQGRHAPDLADHQRSPGLEDLWQLHWSYNGGVEHNPAGLFIANVDEPAVIANILTAPPPAPRGGGPGGPPLVITSPTMPPSLTPPGAAAATPPAAPPTAAPTGTRSGGRCARGASNRARRSSSTGGTSGAAAAAAEAARRTPAPRSGSRSRRRRTERSPSRTHATDSAGRIRRDSFQAASFQLPAASFQVPAKNILITADRLGSESSSWKLGAGNW